MSDTLILILAIAIFVVLYALMMQIRVQVRAFAFRVHRRPLPRGLLEGLRGKRAKRLYGHLMAETWELAQGSDVDRSGAVEARDARGEVLRGHEELLEACGVRAPGGAGPLSAQRVADEALRAALGERGLATPEEADAYLALVERCRYSPEAPEERELRAARALVSRAAGAGGRGRRRDRR